MPSAMGLSSSSAAPPSAAPAFGRGLFSLPAARQVAANLYAMGIPFEFKHTEPGTIAEYERIEL